MREEDCCSDQYLIGFMMPCIFGIFSLFSLCIRTDPGYRKGFMHSFIMMIVFYVIAIVTYYIAIKV